MGKYEIITNHRFTRALLNISTKALQIFFSQNMNIFDGKIPVIVQSSICASAVVFINKCSYNLRQQKLPSLCMCTKFKLYFNFNINKQTKSIRERVFYKNIFWKIRQTLQENNYVGVSFSAKWMAWSLQLCSRRGSSAGISRWILRTCSKQLHSFFNKNQ